MDRQLQNQLLQTVNVVRMLSRDVHGEPVFEVAATPFLCRIEWLNRIVRNAQGENITTTARIITMPEMDVHVSDRLWFPDEAPTLDYPHVIVQTQLALDERGNPDFREIVV